MIRALNKSSSLSSKRKTIQDASTILFNRHNNNITAANNVTNNNVTTANGFLKINGRSFASFQHEQSNAMTMLTTVMNCDDLDIGNNKRSSFHKQQHQPMRGVAIASFSSGGLLGSTTVGAGAGAGAGFNHGTNFTHSLQRNFWSRSKSPPKTDDSGPAAVEVETATSSSSSSSSTAAAADRTTTLTFDDTSPATASEVPPATEESQLSAAQEAMAQFEQQSIATETASTVTTTAAEIATGTAINTWESTWWPQDQMLDLIVYIHDTTGLNYAFTIGAITLSFRTILFPMFVKAQQNSSRMAHVKPHMDAIKAKVDKLDPSGKDMVAQQQLAKEMAAVFKKYDVSVFKSFLVPIVQMPVFMSIFFALRKMPDYYTEELSTGGILWFTDLSAPDPYYILPVLSGFTFIAMLELTKQNTLAASPQQGQMMLNVFRAMGVMIIPFSAYFPTAVLCYWTVNNSFSFCQSAILNNKTMKKKFGIWDPPKPVPGAPKSKGVFEMIQDGMNDKRKDGNTENLKDRIALHNAAIDKRKKKKNGNGGVGRKPRK